MNMEQFLLGAQELGVLERDEVERWPRKLKITDADGQFTFAGMMFAVYHISLKLEMKE